MAGGTINERVIVALGSFSRALESSLAADIASADLTPTQFTVLEILLHKGNSSVNALIKQSLSTGGNIGLVVDNLVKAGLVEKSVDPDDRRGRLVSLTEAGRRRISDYYPQHLVALKDSLGGLERKEKECFIRLLLKDRRHICK